MAADGKTPPTHPQGGGGNIMCTCSIFVCRHKNNDMSTLLGHAHTYIPTDRQTDTQAYIHKSIQTYSYTYTWLHMCDVSPLWGGGVGGNQGGLDHIYIYIYVDSSSIFFLGSEPTKIPSRELTYPTLGKRTIFKNVSWEDWYLSDGYHLSPSGFIQVHPLPCRTISLSFVWMEHDPVPVRRFGSFTPLIIYKGLCTCQWWTLPDFCPSTLPKLDLLTMLRKKWPKNILPWMVV